ncbi:MAG: FAD-binding oxidoreductase [Rhodobacter sp.]|nr:FAD-binding oxidoreductase [Rhodobacter sp.]
MSYDAVIVGGGIIGCTTAYFLSRAGMRVALLERGALARGTTGNSFAWANASTKTADAAYHRLNAAGVAGFRTLAAEFGAETLGIHETGAIQVVSRSDGPGFRAMQDDFAALRGFGYPCRWLDGEALAAEARGLTLPEGAEALLLPADLVIDAPRFTNAIAEAARSGGAVIGENCPALALAADDDGTVKGIETADGMIAAPRVIVAAGADTGRVLAELTGFDAFATRFPLREVPGLLLTTPPLEQNPIRRLIYTSTTDELHLLPAPGGGIRIGSDDVDGAIWEDRSEASMRRGGAALLKRAGRIVPGLSDRVTLDDCTLQVGVRPYPQDGKAIIGPLPGAEELYVLATHSGITLAPAIAAHMPALVHGQTPPDLAPFGLGRFPGF